MVLLFLVVACEWLIRGGGTALVTLGEPQDVDVGFEFSVLISQCLTLRAEFPVRRYLSEYKEQRDKLPN